MEDRRNRRYEVTIPGTEGSARGTFVDMGNPHVVAVIEDAFASLPVVESLDLVTNQWWLRSSNPTRTWNSCGSTTSIRAPAWVKPRCASTNVAAAKPVLRHRLCATGIVLRAKTGISHWDITVRGGTLRVDVTDSDVS